MKSSLRLIVYFFGASFVLNSAWAQQVTWTGGGTGAAAGQWGAGANWSSSAEPTSTDEAFISTTSTITLPSVPTAVGGLFYENTSGTITASTSTFTTDDFVVDEKASLTLAIPTGGQVIVDNPSFVAYIGDSYGSGTLNLPGTGTLSFTSTTEPTFIGVGGVGVVNQSNGTVVVGDTLILGADGNVANYVIGTGTGTGIYNLSGTGTLNAEFLYIGDGSSGTATMSSGTLNISGGSVSTGVIDLAYSSSGTVNGNIGVINQSGGSLNSDILRVGESSGGIGSYTLSGTGTLTAFVMTIGDALNASGTYTQTGGTATVTFMNIGENGVGTAVLQGGSLAITDDMKVGDQTGATGTFTQSGGTLTSTASTFIDIGVHGNGVYNQQGGVVDLAGALNVAADSGSTGTYTLSGGTLTAAGAITLGTGGGIGVFNDNGGTLNANGGVTVSDGSTFNQRTNFDLSSAAANPVTLDSGATYNLTSGTLTIGGDMSTPSDSGISATSGAIFNFNGGTVMPGGVNGDWHDSLTGSVTGNSTIDTANNNAVITGDLGGSGTLTITGANTVDIDLTGGSSTTASWGINVVTGTVSALATTFPSSGNITIQSGGTVDMATPGAGGTTALSGTLTGSGAFDVNFGSNTDTLELVSPVNFSGVTKFANDGSLQVLNGNLGNVTGAGNLVVGGSGTGTVTLTGNNNSYTGATTIAAGSTLLATNLEGVGGGTITNLGTLGLPTTGGTTLTLNGPLNSSGNLLIRMSGNTPDVIAVNGGANISGSITLFNASGNVTAPIVTTAANGDLTYTGPSTFAANALTTATIAANGADRDLILTLTTTSITSLSGINLTPNETAVANIIDPIIQTTTPSQNASILVNAIAPAGISNAQLAQNLEELTPQSLQYADFIGTEHATFLVQKLDYIDSLIRQDSTGFNASAINVTAPGFDSGIGHMMQSMLAFDAPAPGYHNSAPNGTNYYPGDSDSTPSSAPAQTPSSPDPSSQVISDSPAPMPLRTEPQAVNLRQPYSHFSAFVGGDATLADLNQSQSATYAPSSKASYTAADAIAGLSYRMSSNLSAGVLLDYSHTDADTDAYGSKTHIDSYSPGLFATYGNKGFYLNGIFAYSRNDYNNDREIPALDTAATSHPDGNQYTAALDAGYDFHPAQGWTVTPAGGLTYTHLDIDSFTESGAAPADLNVDAQHDDSLRSRLGGSFSYQVRTGQLSLLPSFSAMWQHEFLDDNAPITSNFSDFSSQPFTIHSVNEGSNTALISVGLTATLDSNMAIFIDCTADVGGDYNAENFVGGFKGTF